MAVRSDEADERERSSGDTAPASPAAVGEAAQREAGAGRRDDGFREVRAGERLGRYQIQEAIGEGGMAQVFRAYDPELRRDVAIKVLFPHLSRRADVVRRFHREARAAARLRHPAILQTYDVGGGAGGAPPYIVMELVRGASLQAHPASAAPILSEVVACAGAVIAEALAVAHEAGVIHRDLKPANLLVAEDGRLLLADFGVAHVERDESLATRTGTVLGTPAYMSPEQASGDDVDARCDLYSLGATLYHLATGSLPYSGPPMKVMSQLAQPGSLVAPQARRAEVGRPLSSAIMSLMAHQPASRPADARAAAASLRALGAALGEDGAALDPAAELAAYLRAPEEYLARQTPRVVARLVEQSRGARAAGKLAAAIALADRAAALAPDDETVRQLVREVTSRQASRRTWRTLRTGALAVGLLGAAAATAVWIVGRGEGDERDVVTSADARSADAGSGEAEVRASIDRIDAQVANAGIEAGSASPSSAAPSGTPPEDAAGSAAPSRGGTRRGATSRGGTPPPSREVASGAAPPPMTTTASMAGPGSAAGGGTASEPAAAVATEPAAAMAPAMAPAMASVTFAMDAWCELSIDGEPYGRADRARAISLAPGAHKAVCTQGPGLGQWRGDLSLAPGESRQVTGELSLEVKIVIDVTGSAVAINGKTFPNQQKTSLRNGRHHVVVRQGDRELASGWVSIPRVASCTLRDRPQLDCYP